MELSLSGRNVLISTFELSHVTFVIMRQAIRKDLDAGLAGWRTSTALRKLDIKQRTLLSCKYLNLK